MAKDFMKKVRGLEPTGNPISGGRGATKKKPFGKRVAPENKGGGRLRGGQKY